MPRLQTFHGRESLNVHYYHNIATYCKTGLVSPNAVIYEAEPCRKTFANLHIVPCMHSSHHSHLAPDSRLLRPSCQQVAQLPNRCLLSNSPDCWRQLSTRHLLADSSVDQMAQLKETAERFAVLRFCRFQPNAHLQSDALDSVALLWRSVVTFL